MSWHTTVANAMAENLLLGRLGFATLELVVLSLVLTLVVRWTRFSSQRLVALLWLIVLAKPAVSLVIGSPIAVLRFDVSAAGASQSAQAAAPGPQILPPRADDVLDPAPTFVPDSEAPAPDPARVQASSVGAGERTWLEEHPVGLASLLLAAWAAGVAWSSARYLLVRRKLRQLVARAGRAPEPFESRYAEIARDLGLTRVPALRVTDDLESPALVGLVRPVVLLPRWLVARGQGASLDWAMRHELAHWRWLDPLAILVRDVVSVLFFFHPALPWAARRHAEAMEMACDWESLRDPSEAPDYAEELCGILASIRSRRSVRASASALAMATHGHTARRIAALLEGRPARPLTPRGVVAVGLIALLVFALGCGVSREREPVHATGDAPPAAQSGAESDRAGHSDRGGATKGMEKSVLDGLRWLVRHQNTDGSWSPAALDKRCPCDDAVHEPRSPARKHYDEGLTGLALLGFLGAGFSDESMQVIVDPVTGKRHDVGEVVRKGLDWLVARQSASGSFSQGRTFMYNEALACLAVTRACGLTQSSAWKAPAQKSIDFIQAAQRPSPSGSGLWGWRYAARQEIEEFHRGAGSRDAELLRELYDSDTSTTGWCMLALESGVRAGVTVGRENLEGGRAFIEFVTAENSGLVGYIDRRGAGAKVLGPHDHFVYHPAAMSAIGMGIRVLTGQRTDDPVIDRSAEVIVRDLPAISDDKLSIDYYYWYHASSALNRIDGPDAPTRSGKYWEGWNKALIDCVLELQDHSGHDCRDGGWLVPDRWAFQGGPIYATAINVLTLQTHYRYEHALGGAERK